MAVYDKPMIYYPLPEGEDGRNPGGPGHHHARLPRRVPGPAGRRVRLGHHLVVRGPGTPRRPGVGAFISGANFVGDGAVALVLGDNILQYGAGLGASLRRVAGTPVAHVFAHHAANPGAYGWSSSTGTGRRAGSGRAPAADGPA